jgi:hypothetical protein
MTFAKAGSLLEALNVKSQVKISDIALPKFWLKALPIHMARLSNRSSPNRQLAKFFVHHSSIFLTFTV